MKKLNTIEISFRELAIRLEKEHGVKINIEARPGFGSARLQINISDDDAAQKDFTRYAAMVGADPAWFGQRVSLNGELLKIVGINPNRPKNSMRLLRERDSKEFIGSVQLVKRNLVPVRTAA